MDSLDAGQLCMHLDETDRMCHIWQCGRGGTIKRGELYNSISRIFVHAVGNRFGACMRACVRACVQCVRMTE